jgi:FkbM family methyltransferase
MGRAAVMSLRMTRQTRRAVLSAALSLMPTRLVVGGIDIVYPRIEPELAGLGRYAPRGGTALDVGAWLGPWSRGLRRYADQVVAIEAHPQLAEMLRRSQPAVRVVHAAASDSVGEIDLVVPRGGPLVGVSSVEGGDGAVVSVPRITIDSLGLTDVRFIKMDVEGHERAALLGAEQTIRRDRPLLILELEERMQPIADAVDLLSSWGYTATVLGPTGWIPLADIDLPRHQKSALARVSQSFVRRLVWPHPRYINMVLFRPA